MNERCCRFSLLVCVILASAGLLLFPKDVSGAVSGSVTLCTEILLPTLFPFMVLSGVVINFGAAEMLGHMMQRLMAPVFHLPGVCFAPLLLGLIGGYPTGAKSVATLYRSGACSKQDAEHALAFCNNCGPGFLIGTVGCGLFGEARYGLLLFGIHVLSAVLTGIIFAPETVPLSRNVLKSRTSVPGGFSVFTGSVTDAMRTFLNLSSFVLCFSGITVLIQLSGLPAVLSGFLPVSPQNAGPFLLGFLELSGGALCLTGGDSSERLVLTAILVGWGGFSVHCQVMSILQDTDLSSRLYWRGKAIQGVFSGLLMGCIVTGHPLFIPAAVMTAFIVPRCLLKKRSGNYRESVL